MNIEAPKHPTCKLTLVQKDGTQTSVAVNNLNELRDALRGAIDGSVVQDTEPQPLLIVEVLGSGHADRDKLELNAQLQGAPCVAHSLPDGVRYYFLTDRPINVDRARALAANTNGQSRVPTDATLPIECAAIIEPKIYDVNARVIARFMDPSQLAPTKPLTLSAAEKRSKQFRSMVRACRDTPSHAEELMVAFARQHVPRSMADAEFTQLAREQLQSVVAPGQPGALDAQIRRALDRAATSPATERFHALAKDNTGKPLATQANVNICIETLLGLHEGLIKHNKRDQMRYVTETPPWCMRDTRPYPRPIVDADYTQICTLLQNSNYEYPHASGKSVSAAINAATTQIEDYDPVVDYIEVCYDAWPADQLAEAREYLETVLIRHAGAEDTPYVRAVTRCWFLIAVKRALEPGCKYREVLVLLGAQLAGKSSFFAALVPDLAWFLEDCVIERGNDRVARGLRGKWIVELPEIDKQLKVDRTGEMKSFISTNIDNLKPLYVEHCVDLPRSVVFGGSTNEQHFFHDATGNTRFNVVNVGEVDHVAVGKERDRIWGAAARLLCDTELQPYLNRGELALARAKQSEHYAAPPETQLLDELVNGPAPAVVGSWLDSQKVPEAYLRGGALEPSADTTEKRIAWAGTKQLVDYLAERHVRVTPQKASSAMRSLGWIQIDTPSKARVRVGRRVWCHPAVVDVLKELGPNDAL